MRRQTLARVFNADKHRVVVTASLRELQWCLNSFLVSIILVPTSMPSLNIILAQLESAVMIEFGIQVCLAYVDERDLAQLTRA